MSALTVCTASAEPDSHWQPAESLSVILTSGACDVIRHWISNAEYLDEYNEPVVIPAVMGDEPGFGRLVRAANNHLSPISVLGELLRKGIVEQLDSSQLFLRHSAYVPAPGRRASAAIGQTDNQPQIPILRVGNN